MYEIIKNLTKEDLIYNYLSLVFLALSGLVLNIIIGLNYNIATLGVFNQVLTTYIIFSMIGSFGVQFSVLHLVSSNSNNIENLKSIVSSGLFLVLITSGITIILYLISIYPLSRLLDSNDIRDGMLFITPGLFFFSINKVLLNGVINGLRKMKLFAFLQSLRYLLILLALTFATFISLNGNKLSLVFSFSEITLCIINLMLLRNLINLWQGKFVFKLIKTHLIFGSKSFWGGILLEMNSKIDIFMIGLFLSDSKVGIYSFCALFVEGFFQIFTVLQNIYNPILSYEINKGDIIKIKNIFKKNFLRSYIYIIPLSIILIAIYPKLIRIITNSEDYLNSFPSFIVLLCSMTAASPYFPFYNIFNMANMPGVQSMFILLIMLSNIIANYIYIPKFGIIGAAIGTSFSLILSVFIFKNLANEKIGLKL